MQIQYFFLSIFLINTLAQAEHAIPTNGRTEGARISNTTFDSARIKTLKSGGKTTLVMWHTPSDEIPRDYKMPFGLKGFNINAVTKQEFGPADEDRNYVFYRSSTVKDRELNEIWKAAQSDQSTILEVEIDINSTTESIKQGFGNGSGSKFTLKEIKKIVYKGSDGKPLTLYLGK